MADNDTRIRITVEDLASSVFARLEGQVGQLGDHFGVAGRALESLATSIGGVGLAIAGTIGALVGTAAGIYKIGMTAIEAGDHLADLSAQVGVSGETLSAYSQHLSNSGSSVDSFAKALGKMEVSLDSARGGSEESIAAFRRLGLSMSDIKNASPEEALRKVADAVQNTNDPVKTAGALSDVFGKSWRELVPALKGGSEALDEAKEKAESLGAVMSDEFVSRADQTRDAVDDLGLIFKGFSNMVAAELMPIIFDGAKSLLDFAKNSELVKSAAESMGFTFKVVVSVLAVVVDALIIAGQAVYTTARAIWEAANGNFSAAWETLKSHVTNVGDVIATTSAKISDMWMGTGRQFQETSNGNANALLKIGDAASKTKPEVDKVAKATEDFIGKLNEQANALERQAQTGEKATAADKAMESAIQALRAGKISDTAATWDQIRAEIERIDTAEKKIETDKRQAAQALDLAKAWDEVEAAKRKENETATEALSKAREELDNIGKTKEQLALMKAARLDDAAATLEQRAAILANAGAIDDEYDRLMRNAQTYRDAAQTIRQSGYAEAASDQAKESQKAFEQASQTIERSLTDSLMRAFEGGASFAQAFTDGLKNLFKSLILKPVIQAIVQPITAGITGFMGLSGAASATGSAGSSAMGALSGANTLASVGSKLFGAGSFMGGIGTGLSAWGAEGSVMGMFANPGLYTGAELLGAALPVALPVLFAAYALSSGMFEGSDTRFGSAYGYSRTGGATADMRNIAAHANAGHISYLNPNAVTRLAGPGDGSINGSSGEAATARAVADTVTSINNLLSGVGSSARVDQFWGKVESSQEGRGGVLAGGILTGGAQFGYGDMLGNNYAGTQFDPRFSTSPSNEQALKDFATELQDATVSALKAATDIPSSVRKILDSVSDSASAITQIGALVVGVKAMATQFIDWGGAFSRLSTVSFDARAAILGLTGGIDQFAQKANAYISSYYTSDEQAAITAAGIVRKLAQVDFKPSDTWDLYSKGDIRYLIDAQTLDNPDSQAKFAALLDVAPAFASISDYLTANHMGLGELASLAPGGVGLTALTTTSTASETTATATVQTAASMQTLVDVTTAASDATTTLLTSIDNRLATIATSATLTASAPVTVPLPSYSNDVG